MTNVNFKELFGEKGLLQITIDGAKSNYSDYQEELLDILIREVAKADFEWKEAQQFLIEALEETKRTNDANKAFLQKGLRGVNKKTMKDLEKRLIIAEEVYLCCKQKIPGETKNRLRYKPRADCISEVAEKYCISYDRVEDLYKEFKAFIKQQEEHA